MVLRLLNTPPVSVNHSQQWLEEIQNIRNHTTFVNPKLPAHNPVLTNKTGWNIDVGPPAVSEAIFI